jgi:hypothetical protein
MARKLRLIQLNDANTTNLNLHTPPQGSFDPQPILVGVFSATDYPSPAVEASIAVVDNPDYDLENAGPVSTPLAGASAENALSGGGTVRGIVRFSSGNVRLVIF